MQDEIFGPILPIMRFKNLNSLLSELCLQPKPLSAYFFSSDKGKQDEFVRVLPFGGGCINDTVIQVGNPYLPFGGVGDSGMGAYHGRESFITFSHSKSLMRRTSFLDLSARYAPYTGSKVRLLRRLLKVPG
jgi:aldehyde dehydrogenase (NAD+)